MWSSKVWHNSTAAAAPVRIVQGCLKTHDMNAAGARHDTVLRHVSPKRVDSLGPLPYQQITRLERHRRCLLLGRLHRDEAHGRTACCLGDSLGIGHVILLARHKGLHISRRDETDLMPERRNLPGPVMSAPARLHGNHGLWHRGEE